MSGDQDNQKNLIDTTDCLEAVGVFRGWKNFLFIVIICCLSLLQTSFWLVNTGLVETGSETLKDSSVVAVTQDTEQINQAAKQVVAFEPNQTTEAEVVLPDQQQATPSSFGVKFDQLAWFIRFFNFALVIAATLYCLTILFSLKVSLLGRLGGINHISRAFFLSLAMLVLLLPWQKFFAGVVAGAIYTPAELLDSYTAAETRGVFGTILFYLRFTVYWLLVMLLLAFSQFRSSRWARAILRRLEVI